jgi:hypothetical protein
MAYTAAQLVSLACQIAKTPGMLTQAGQFMNMILADYAQTMDLDVIRLTYTLNINAGSASYALPANFLRSDEVFYNVNGTIFYLNQIPLSDYDQEFQGPGISNYPQQYATDIAQSTGPTIYFWPPPALPLAVTLRYRPQTTDITTPETSSVIPWFPNQRLLLKDLCVELFALADDSRGAATMAEVESRMKKYLVMDDDKEGFARQVILDRRFFRPNGNARNTKQQPL